MIAGKSLPTPGMVHGAYPERRGGHRGTGIWERACSLYAGLAPLGAKPDAAFAQRVLALSAGLALDAAQLEIARAALAREGINGNTCARIFALACTASRLHLGMTPYATQLMAARAMLDGQLAEMATGEGKTLAIALAAAAAALAGAPVHVITANDYLAARDCAAFRAFYAALGLRAAAITQELPRAGRAHAYAADITYCTAKEVAFDYLRDSLARPHRASDLERRALRIAGADAGHPLPLLRGLCVAIIDEADTLLIDEARVPLVLSRASGETHEPGFLRSALHLAGQLAENTHFSLLPRQGIARLTAAGEQRVAAWTFPGAGASAHRHHQADAICLALAALHLYQRDRDYVVRAGAVEIVDESTGRRATGRAWSHGLHQLIELKEGCAPTPRSETAIQITYQRFFRRYLHLCGMSGTLRECAAELRLTYGLLTTLIPLRLPSQRRAAGRGLFAREQDLHAAAADRAARLCAQGRPVLIGVSTVAQSEALSARLAAMGLRHTVLNARQDREEAAIVARAGAPGQITVATSMAGRGTDIAIGLEAARAGGLHVILCQRNASPRIDRQFIGRAGRRGEPGSFEIMLAPPASEMGDGHRAALTRWANRIPLLFHLLTRWPQWLEQRAHARQRRRLDRADALAERRLAFSARNLS